MAANPLPNPNRYITDNDDDGQSFFSTKIPAEISAGNDLSGALQRLAYTTEQPPVQLTKDTDLKANEDALKSKPPLVKSGGGAKIWYIDVPPGGESPMHRTMSLDFVVQIAGEIELIMSNGESRTIKPGDTAIQRSTLHKWRNNSTTEWSRMVGVLSECQPAVTKKGDTLSTFFPST